MSKSLFSPSWHAVAQLKPRLLAGTLIKRHTYRNQVWYVLQNASGGKYFRINQAAHRIVSGFDGSATVQSLWDAACQRTPYQHSENTNPASLDKDIPTQNDLVQLLTQLHEADLLQVDIPPDAHALFERYKKRKRQTWKQWITNPTSLKIPLINPEAFLTATTKYFGWVFSPIGFIIWLLVVLAGGVLALQHSQELSENISDQLLLGQNLLLIALIFPILKALHELAHGFAVKHWGGFVHEMGIMFLVFVPSPYVNASASSAFPSKWRRAIVGAAGMMIETFIASLALFFWLSAEPGLPRAIAYNVMLIAGVTTILFNANPLLRYDGYFILCDLLEIPNLAQRGQKLYSYLWDKYIFGAKEIEPPKETPSEKRILLLYKPLAYCYKVFIMVSIILFIANAFFILGVIVALMSTFTLFIKPLWKIYKHIQTSHTLQRRRPVAKRITLAIIAVLLIVLGAIPMPLRTQTQGVVWLPEKSAIRAQSAGFFEQWDAIPGQIVQANTPIVSLSNPTLQAELALSQARVNQLEAQLRATRFSNATEADVLQKRLDAERAQLSRATERSQSLHIHASVDGIPTALQPQDLPGKFFKQGEQIGYLITPSDLLVRAVVAQDDIDLVRSKLKGIQLRLVDDVDTTYSATIIRQHTGGIHQVPSAALGIQGGGIFPTDPQDSNGTKTLNRVFWFDLKPPDNIQTQDFGKRVYVRFSHDPEPLAQQAYRRLRQLFLSKFQI